MRLWLWLMLSLFATGGAQAMQSPPDPQLAPQHVERIGRMLAQAAPQGRGQLFFVAELDDGYMSHRLLWHALGASSLRDVEMPLELTLSITDAALDAWEESGRQGNGTAWTMMTFLVEDGRFSVRVSRPTTDGDDAFNRFADAAVARVFPGLPIEPVSMARPPSPPVRGSTEQVPTAADIERIRAGLIAAAGTTDARIVLFARFDERMSASVIRYRRDNQPGVSPGQFPTQLDPGLGEIWNAARQRMGQDVWRELIVIVDHGVARFTLRQPSNPDFHAGFSQTAAQIEQAEFSR